MKCIECGERTRVIGNRSHGRRRRLCVVCGKRFTTIEIQEGEHRKEQTCNPGMAGPWLPLIPWREWLAGQQIDFPSKVDFCWRLGISTRRLYSWLHDNKQKFVRLHLVEDCLWKFGGETNRDYEWTDIWDRSDLIEYHPSKTEENKQEQ